MILETERLVLRKLEQSDFDEVCKLLQDPVVMYAYEGAFNEQEVQAWLDKMFWRYENEGMALWGVIEKGSGELIGQCGITYQDFNGKRVPEIGYLFRKEFWHKGFATEAAIACKEYAFQVLNFDEIYSIIRDTNIPSQKVALRNGMIEIGRLVKHYRGIDMPHIVFRVSKKYNMRSRLF
ncbi:MAG TPA: GNAT family N-acetyltransferase [Candidatus Butyricimonas faecavium]|nr:GNAT family N-acetyltransferase [Candidatus Butyricimonas faecavium]